MLEPHDLYFIMFPAYGQPRCRISYVADRSQSVYATSRTENHIAKETWTIPLDGVP